MRYYSDLIDVQLLSTGTDYDKLPNLAIIFILSYDPFGKNAMYYEAGTTLKTHPEIPYDDGIRRIYLYTGGELPENADEYDRRLQALLKYIEKSTEENVTDDTTKRLDEIVNTAKKKKEIGVRYMKSWEREQELIAEGKAEGKEEERVNTEAERARADAAEARADDAEARADDAEARADDLRAELAKYRSKYGSL